MINETIEMRAARHELQTLSASDPIAQANMLRHVAACTLLLTGRAAVKALPRDPLFSAGFRLVNGEERLWGAMTRTDAIDRIYIAFDIDDPQGPPVGLGIFRKEGEHAVCHGFCKIWSPAEEGRSLLVPLANGKHSGYFAYRPGQPFRWTQGHVPGDLVAGVRRAHTRTESLLKAFKADPQPRRGFALVASNVGQTLIVRPLPWVA